MTVDESADILKNKIDDVLMLIIAYGQIEGDHHSKWVIDQIVRKLVIDYDLFLKAYKEGKDGPNTYYWNEGIAP